MYALIPKNSDYLAHHGILGQKWGVRRYQNKDGSLTDLGRRRRNSGENKGTVKKMIQKAKDKAADKKVKDAETKHENLKRFVRNHPKSIYKHRMDFSQDEINQLVKDIEFDRKLKDVRNEEIKRGWDKVQKISNNLGTVKNLAENAKGIYNLATEINNLMVDSGKLNRSKMLKIGEKADNNKDDDWFVTNLKKSNYEELLKNKEKLTNTQLTDINKRYTQEELLKKNFGIDKDVYVGKHLKHCFDLQLKDII